jgi:hypothetical protein
LIATLQSSSSISRVEAMSNLAGRHGLSTDRRPWPLATGSVGVRAR